MISLSTYSKALKPSVDIWFGGAYQEKPEQWRELFDVRQSSQNFEEAVNHFGFGLAVLKPQGGSISYDDPGQGGLIRFQHSTYGLGFKITREAVEDNLYKQIAQSNSAFLARSMRQTKEILSALVYDRAFTGGTATFDGVDLGSTSHVLQKTLATYNNILATAADLSEEALKQMYIDVDNFKDDAGNRIVVMPRKLIVSKENRFVAELLLKNEMQIDSADRNMNLIKSMSIIPEGYRVNNYLTDPDAWFVLTDQPDGMVFYQRRAMEMGNDTADFDTENMSFKATERYSFGAIDPRGFYGSPGG